LNKKFSLLKNKEGHDLPHADQISEESESSLSSGSSTNGKKRIIKKESIKDKEE